MNSRSLQGRIIRLAMVALGLACMINGTRPSGSMEQGQFSTTDRSPANRMAPITGTPISSRTVETLIEPDLATRNRLTDSFARLPLCFEVNQGQAPSNARFVSAGSAFKLLFSPTEWELAARQQNSNQGGSLRMHLVNANPRAEMHGVNPLPTRANYLTGNDRSRWHTNIPTFARVVSERIYPGVDMVYYGNQRQLEYDFVVAPGADPASIRLRFSGTQNIAIDAAGNLTLQTHDTEVRHNKPVAYQELDGARHEVPVAFSLLADGTTSFNIGDYDRSSELVIDPVLVFSTYLGGSEADLGRGIFVDSGGNAYVLGDSRSSDFTHGSADNADIFIGKFTADGGAFGYTFFGGSKDEIASGLAADADGNTYISGSTQSDNLASEHSINPALSGLSDAFVIKLNPTSGLFFYSTLVGGAGDETGISIAIDGAGNAYISGKTTSTDFPTANAIQPSYGGGDSDAFVSKIAPDGASLVYSTYFGGGDTENLVDRSGIAVDSAGNAYVTGDTRSGDLPLSNALRSTKSGNASSFDAYISKIDPTGGAFVYSTYLGGSEDDIGLDVATDSCGQCIRQRENPIDELYGFQFIAPAYRND